MKGIDEAVFALVTKFFQTHYPSSILVETDIHFKGFYKVITWDWCGIMDVAINRFHY